MISELGCFAYLHAFQLKRVLIYFRYQALNERKLELQDENAELRRQLAGLTPNRMCSASRFSSPYAHCTGCVCLKKQKARQAKVLPYY